MATSKRFDPTSRNRPRAQHLRPMLQMLASVAIIAILATFGYEQYNRYRGRALITSVLVQARSAQNAVTETKLISSRWPENNKDAGLPPPEVMAQLPATSIKVRRSDQGSVVVITMGDALQLERKVSSETLPANRATLVETANTTLFLQASMQNGQIRWLCHSDSIPPKYLPAVCRHGEQSIE